MVPVMKRLFWLPTLFIFQIRTIEEELSGPLIGMHFFNSAPILDVMQKETGDMKYRLKVMLKHIIRDKKPGRRNGKWFYKY